MASKNPAAPKFLNLFLIKLPPSGIASIAHRVSGVVMFLSIPLLAYLFALSLQGEQGFSHARDIVDSPLMLPIMLILIWSLSHHLLAGIRHLLLDISIGVQKHQARFSAWLVNIGALILTAIYLVGCL